MRRVLKENAQISAKYARDPILEGEPAQISKKPANFCTISPSYARFKEKLMFLPADRSQPRIKPQEKPADTLILAISEENWQKNSQKKLQNQSSLGSECKKLLNYEFALPFRRENFSRQVTDFGIEERSFLFADVNTKDFRRKALLGKYKEFV